MRPPSEVVQSYPLISGDSRYEIEVHSRRGTREDEIVVMVECSSKRLMGTFSGQAKYFVISKTSGVRDIERDEAF